MRIEMGANGGRGDRERYETTQMANLAKLAL